MFRVAPIQVMGFSMNFLVLPRILSPCMLTLAQINWVFSHQNLIRICLFPSALFVHMPVKLFFSQEGLSVFTYFFCPGYTSSSPGTIAVIGLKFSSGLLLYHLRREPEGYQLVQQSAPLRQVKQRNLSLFNFSGSRGRLLSSTSALDLKFPNSQGISQICCCFRFYKMQVVSWIQNILLSCVRNPLKKTTIYGKKETLRTKLVFIKQHK